MLQNKEMILFNGKPIKLDWATQKTRVVNNDAPKKVVSRVIEPAQMPSNLKQKRVEDVISLRYCVRGSCKLRIPRVCLETFLKEK